MPCILLLLILMPIFVGAYIENENPVLHQHVNHGAHSHYKGWTGPPTTLPQNYRTESPPIVLSEVTDDWTSIPNLEEPRYESTVIDTILDEALVQDFAEKLATDDYLGKESPKDDYRGLKQTTDMSPNLEPEPKWETVPPRQTYNEATQMVTSVKEPYADLGSNSEEDGSSEEDKKLLLPRTEIQPEPEPKWETVQPLPTYNEATPMATSVKERYADLGSNSDEDGSSEEGPRLLSEEEYLPTEKEELPIPPAGGEIKVFADIDDRDIIQYLSGDAAKARALVDAMAKDVQDPQDDIDKGQSELPRDDAEEKTFDGVDDSDLLNYLARDPKVAEKIIDKAKRINLR